MIIVKWSGVLYFLNGIHKLLYKKFSYQIVQCIVIIYVIVQCTSLVCFTFAH